MNAKRRQKREAKDNKHAIEGSPRTKVIKKMEGREKKEERSRNGGAKDRMSQKEVKKVVKQEGRGREREREKNKVSLHPGDPSHSRQDKDSQFCLCVCVYKNKSASINTNQNLIKFLSYGLRCKTMHVTHAHKHIL